MMDQEDKPAGEEHEANDEAVAPETQVMTPARKPGIGELLLPFLIMGAVLALDQFTKYLVETRIPLYSYWAPIPGLEDFLRITHTANTGAVFGLFQGNGIIFTALAFIVVGGLIYFNFTLPGGQWLLRLALGLMLGGAAGNNLVDRLRQGHVTDFVDIGPWYIFNVADMAIVSGIILFGFLILRDGWESQEKSPSTLHPADTQD